MKRLLFALVAFCLLALPVGAAPDLVRDLTSPATISQLGQAPAAASLRERVAWYTGGGELQGYWVGGAEPATITFLQCTKAAGGAASATFTSENVGTASADRYTIVGVSLEDGATNFSISSMTIGGDAATEVIDSVSVTTGSLVVSGVYIMANPSGTAEDIVVTASETVSTFGICTWQANKLLSATATDTAAQFQTASAACVVDLDVNAHGIAVGMGASPDDSVTVTWTGMTERAEGASGDPIDLENTGADFDEDDTASVPLSANVDMSGTNDTTCASASFR